MFRTFDKEIINVTYRYGNVTVTRWTMCYRKTLKARLHRRYKSRTIWHYKPLAVLTYLNVKTGLKF